VLYRLGRQRDTPVPGAGASRVIDLRDEGLGDYLEPDAVGPSMARR